MAKDFMQWHGYKSQLEDRNNTPDFNEREVWLVSLGANIGHEEDGKHEKFLRPVVILKKFNRDMFWGVPLTSTEKAYKHYYLIEIAGRRSFASFLQLRAIDRRRLFQKMAIISEADFVDMKKRIGELLDLTMEKQNPSAGGDLQSLCQPSEAEASVSDEPAVPQA